MEKQENATRALGNHIEKTSLSISFVFLKKRKNNKGYVRKYLDKCLRKD